MDNKSFELDGANGAPDTISQQKISVDVRGSSARRPLVFRNVTGKLLVAATIALFVICVVLIVLLAVEKNKDSDSHTSIERNKTVQGSTNYTYSDEANRGGLKEFLKKVQTTYFEYHRYNLAWQPDKTYDEISDDLKARHMPYNSTPAYLKSKTDAALALLKEIKNMGIDENKLKPRELKAVEQTKHFLTTVFGSPFDENFYNGDWMLGPNHFCWQAMCYIGFYINGFAHYVRPNNTNELVDILRRIMLNRDAILQYKSNMELGVKTGMVRAKVSCQSGLDAFKQQFKKISNENKPEDVLNEWFVKKYTSEKFTVKISKSEQENWKKEYNKNVSRSVEDALVEGIGKPLVELLNYLEYEHVRNCLPDDLGSGLGSLPVDYIYYDGKRTANRTTKTLPITNQVLNGKMSYKNILPYFTTSDITPERINEIGKERLNVLYPQVLEIARNITKVSNQTEAVIRFRHRLKQQKQFYNDAPFPVNESNATAHKLCHDPESAAMYCPNRWAAMLTWKDTARQVMSMLAPKLIPLFYHTGKKITVPNCPIEMLPSFNPSGGAQFFRQSGSSCTGPAYFGLPFFLENLGPRFSEWSVTAHEAWPGHHTQIQAQLEYFKDPYGGTPKWIDDESRSTFFIEGWALYSENPVIAHDTDTYQTNLLQKYGMLKWQIWRALRLIIDTGLHYRGMNRSTALQYFSRYAWDDTDLARKEVTRYQGVPGQATAYMLGQQKLVELRNFTRSRLGKKFAIQDFHYQVLSLGSAPEGYLTKHVQKYVKCTLGELKGEQCEVILKPRKRSDKTDAGSERPPRPPEIHYI